MSSVVQDNIPASRVRVQVRYDSGHMLTGEHYWLGSS